MVVATWHFHVFQRLQAWIIDKLQHAPSFVSSKQPMQIVPLVAGAPPHVAKPTARHKWNHVRGVVSIPPRSEPRFTDTAPTVEERRWQLTQAVITTERTWVFEPMARHHHVAPPRTRPESRCCHQHTPRLVSLVKYMPDLSWSKQGGPCCTPKRKPRDSVRKGWRRHSPDKPC